MASALASGPARILHVDDNVADLELCKLALDDCCRGAKQHVGIRDPSAAAVELSLLDASDDPLPDLVILDINMPRIDGWALLRLLKQSRRLADIPVVMLTTTSRAEDAQRARSQGAELYVKPGSFEELTRMMMEIQAKCG